MQPIRTESVSQQSAIAETTVQSSSTVENAASPESQSVVQLAAAEVVVQSLPASESATEAVAIATAVVPTTPVTESFARSKLVDTAVNDLSSQSRIRSEIKSPTLSAIIGNWSQGALVGKQAGETGNTVFASSRDGSTFALGMTEKHASASTIRYWLPHLAALEAIVSYNDTDAEAVLDIARHARVKQHTGQLEDVLNRVLHEEEDAFLLIQ